MHLEMSSDSSGVHLWALMETDCLLFVKGKKSKISLLFDSFLLSAVFLFKIRCSLCHDRLHFPQSCKCFVKKHSGVICVSVGNVVLLAFAHSSQLPPRHPPAPPEHLKEPLVYMRKAQVGPSAFISSLSLLFPDSYHFCLPNSLLNH